jgi:photosynthetic reaction center cytochrome c subunit
VAPDKGCAYCHEGSDLASDGLYTKIVSRRMIEMTRHLNSEWASHVGDTGVTCMTCHRGKAVPEGAWTADAGPATAKGAAGNRRGQNVAAPAVGLSSLPYDPFTPLLTEKNPHLRVSSTTALPTGTPGSIAHTEQTYALMMNISQSLGVNCTYCHNSQAFGNWAASPPQRVTAYHGLQMVRDLNKDYLIPLKSALPAERLGPQGDAPKVACVTCHAGQAKPLNGASLLKEFPELRGKTKAAAQAAAPAK